MVSIQPTPTADIHPINRQLDELVRQIVLAVHPLKIVLFGSAARDQFGPHSDLDLLVVMPDGTHRRKTAQQLYRTITAVSVPFDLVVVTSGDLALHGDNPGLIYRAALAEGRTLYAV